MALQGDLHSFALPDVLRLLAGTAKTGRLEVRGPGTRGELGMRSGGIANGALDDAPREAELGEVLFEMLRLERGSFAFDEEHEPSDGPTTDVEFALERAEALVREWAEVEEIVPSMDVWVALDGADRDDDLLLSPVQWRTIVAIGGGGTVHDLAATLESGDLEACRSVASLVEAGIVDIRSSHVQVAPAADTGFQPFELDSFEDYETEAEPAAMTGLEDLVVEDRPVVMEDSDDALLPEPLPGEGVAYDGEEITGAVDGRTFGVADADADADAYAAVDEAPLAETLEEFVGAEPAIDVLPAADDDERGSLLRFLSTVKH